MKELRDHLQSISKFADSSVASERKEKQYFNVMKSEGKETKQLATMI